MGTRLLSYSIAVRFSQLLVLIKMPSKVEVKLFQLYSKSFSDNGVFGVDSTPSGQLITTTSKYKLVLHYLFTLLALSNYVFLIYRCHATYKYSSPESVDVVIQMGYIFLLVADCAGIGMIICFVACRVQLVCLWNQLIRLSMTGNCKLYNLYFMVYYDWKFFP